MVKKEVKKTKLLTDKELDAEEKALMDSEGFNEAYGCPEPVFEVVVSNERYTLFSKEDNLFSLERSLVDGCAYLKPLEVRSN